MYNSRILTSLSKMGLQLSNSASKIVENRGFALKEHGWDCKGSAKNLTTPKDSPDGKRLKNTDIWQCSSDDLVFVQKYSYSVMSAYLAP